MKRAIASAPEPFASRILPAMVVLILACAGCVSAQTVSPAKRFTLQDVPLREAISSMARGAGLNFVFHKSSLRTIDHTTTTIIDRTAAEGLDDLFASYPIGYTQLDRRTIMVVSKELAAGGARPIADMIETANQKEDDVRGTVSGIDVIYHDLPVLPGIKQLASFHLAGLSLSIDPAIEDWLKSARCSLELRNVRPTRALKYVLDAYDLTYEKLGTRRIRVLRQNSDSSSSTRPSLEEIVKESN